MAINASVLSSSLPQLQQAEQTLARLAAAQGIEYRIAPFGGFRTETDTAKILKYRDDDYSIYVENFRRTKPGVAPMPKEQWRKIAPFGKSFHDYGAAFDIQITKAKTGLSNADSLAVVGSLATQAGLRWGKSFGDSPHFELAISLADAMQLWNAFRSGKGVPAGAVAVGAASSLAILGLLLLAFRRWL